jgi:hypothetical protein
MAAGLSLEHQCLSLKFKTADYLPVFAVASQMYF